MMLLPGLQILLWRCVTLNFDLLSSKVDRFIPVTVDHSRQLAAKSVYSF